MKEITPPQIPEDLNTAIKSGKVRAPTHIISTISDDRGTEFAACYHAKKRINGMIKLESYDCIHFQVKSQHMLACQCPPLLNRDWAWVMSFLCCGLNEAFLVIALVLLRYLYHGTCYLLHMFIYW